MKDVYESPLNSRYASKEMKEIFLQDQRESTQIFLKNWVKRSWRQKAVESIVRLLAPLL